MSRVKAGSAVFIRIQVRLESDNPPTLFNPSGGVAITIKDPAGTAQVSAAAMSNESKGKYTYNYQTSSSGVLGDWTVEFTSVNSSTTVKTVPMQIFTLVA